MLHFLAFIPNVIAVQAIPHYRRLTSPLRSLPDFIIIGAQKGGTSSLFHYLSQHPQIEPSSVKEVHFFDGGLDPKVDTYAKGVSWYRKHFPLRMNLKRDCIAGEASPLYLFNPLAPARISGLLPDVKLIVLLRDPTERAISHYFHEKRKKRESLPLMEALEREESRMRPVIEAGRLRSKDYIHHSYKSRGLYLAQIERFLKFFRREQLLIVSSEDFFEQPQNILRQVFEFLEVDDSYEVQDMKPMNVGHNRTDAPAEAYDYLREYFLPHNKLLYEFLGRDFGWQVG